MKIILKILNVFFVILGIIFLIILIIAAYFIITDPFGLKPLLKMTQTATDVPISNSIDKHPLLTAEQERFLESFGINPATLPTEITPTMEQCFIDKLGAARVKEIEQGSELTTTDFLKASSCLSY